MYLSARSGVLDQSTYSFDPGSQRTQQVFTAGNYVNYTYEKIGQVKTARGYESDGLTLRLQEQFGYAYDKGWNLNYRTNNGLTETFAANAVNELSNIGRSGTLTVAGSVGSAYGPISVTASGTGLPSGVANVYADGTWALGGASPASGQNSYTATATDGYNRSSQDSVTVTLLGTNSYTYDASGNLLSDGQRTFAYDDENQLSSVTVSNAWRCEFVNDGMLRRRKRLEYTWSGGAWLKTNEVHYVYDGRLVVQERDGNNLPLVTYTRGSDLSGRRQGAGGISGLLARTDSSLLALGSSFAHAYYHCDGNGNVTCLINASNAVVARYTYDPFGNVLSMGGPLAGANLYRFSSKEAHANSGLVYYLYRYYEPNLQRWVNSDPIGERGGINLYQFVFNEPVHRADLYGLSAADVEKILDTCNKTIKELTDAGKRSNSGDLNNLRRTLGDKKKMGCGEQAAYLSDKLQKTQTDDSWTINAAYVHQFPIPTPHQFLILKSDNDDDPILYLDPWNGTCGKKPPANISNIESIDKMGTTDCTKDKEKKQ